MLGEYAYLLAPGGLLYTITDVKQLADWMQLHTSQHPCFERVPEESLVRGGGGRAPGRGRGREGGLKQQQQRFVLPD